MTIVALTGGIAAGKTTVCERLAKRGIAIVDADVLAREVVEPGSPTLATLRREFGEAIISQDGSLDREALGALVFGHPEQLQRLNDIVHPAVKSLSQKRFEEIRIGSPEQVLVYAVPLIAESGRGAEFDTIVLVDAPRDQRITRLVENRGMSLEEATSRVDSQASDSKRRDIADVILDASGDLERTVTAADQLADALTAHWPDRLDSLPAVFPRPSS
jgi:dephospho-CoA kinase